MPRKKRQDKPLEWIAVLYPDNQVRIGSYAVRDGIITVMNREGLTKSFSVSRALHDAFARLLLSERFG